MASLGRLEFTPGPPKAHPVTEVASISMSPANGLRPEVDGGGSKGTSRNRGSKFGVVMVEVSLDLVVRLPVGGKERVEGVYRR